MSSSFIGRVAGAALTRFDAVMDWLGLSGGKASGREYLPVNPKRADCKPGSFSINRDSGAWQDFATGDKGGDLVSLAAWCLDCGQGDAARKLAGFLGLPVRDPAGRDGGRTGGDGAPTEATASPAPEKSRHGPESKPGEAFVMPVPDDAPPPPSAHGRHGKPSRRWAYTDAAGQLCFYHDRYEAKADGDRKQFAPLTLWRRPDGRLVWQFKAPPAPRPLLGLPELTAKPGPAVLTEGEKARDAAATLLPDHAVLTWQGGAQAVAKADLSPLAGREVWLWPDADEAGEKAARDLSAALEAAGAGPLKRFSLAHFGQVAGESAGAATLAPGGEWNTGDDAADLVARGWTAAHLALILALPDGLQAIETAPAVPRGTDRPAEAADSEKPARRFELQDRGVFFFEPDKSPRWICAPVEVTAMVRDPQDRGWGLLVEFSDPDRNPHRVIVPMQLFRGDGAEVAGLLLDHGLKIAPRGRPLLLEYLQTSSTRKRARVTGRTGWHPDGADGATYVLPDQAFGPNDGAWLFEAEGVTNTFTVRGSLQGWQQEIGALCRGNSRLLFSVSLAFAAPLLYLTGSESGGFHFRSNSSDGKTTAMRVAASVCGGADYMRRFRATDNGIEAVAMQHCDGPLLLDEIAQVDPKVAGDVVYMLANGSGKTRAGRTGGARDRASWRVLFLSAGEIGLAEHMGEIGKTPRAGQELRLAEISADAGAGLGVFENLHGCASGSEFAKTLDRAVRRHHGAPFVAYLRELAKRQQDVADLVREAQRVFESRCLSDGAHGQARRVAARFALVGAGGELATKLQITGWQQGEAMAAARTCFEAWLSRRGGQGNQEERAMLQQVREFLRRHGEGVFTDWDRPANDTDKHAPRITDRAGYRRHNADADASEFFVFVEPFRSRICKGFDPAAVGRLLLERGYIERGTEKGREWQVKVAIPTEGRPRVVHVLPAIWDDDDD